MPLPETYRLQAYNESGESLGASDIDVHIKLWKFTSAGALSYSSEAVSANNASIADDAYGNLNGATGYVDNSTDLYMGFHGYISVAVATGGSTEKVTVWLQNSPDGGTDWGPDGGGRWLCTIDLPSTGTYEAEVEYN